MLELIGLSTDKLVKWGLISTGIIAGLIYVYVKGWSDGSASCQARMVKATATLNARIEALGQAQEEAEEKARAETEAAVRAATERFEASSCRALTDAERKRLDQIK